MSAPSEPPAGQSAVAAELLARGIAVRMRVKGVSMQPTLRSNDVVELEPVHAAHVRIGDIVLSPGPGQGWLLHRIVRHAPRTRGWLQTRGDALWRLDRPVPASQILGRVRRAERDGGTVFRRRPVVDRLRAGVMLMGSALRYRLESATS